MRQRGSIIVYGVIALFVAAAGTTFVLTYKSAITRAEKAENELAGERAKFKTFREETARLGREAQAKADEEIARQKGVSDARIKSLEGRLAATRSQFDKLRNAGAGKGAGSNPVPAVPDTARPADDTARDQRLLDVLQHAQEQADRLIELQDWIRGQSGAKKSPAENGAKPTGEK